MRYLSPLRYPGGKARLAPYIAQLLAAQPTRPSVYAEPFAGGAGAALNLLIDEEVRSVRLNDLNPGIAAFWRSVFNHTNELATRIEEASISIADWRIAAEIYATPAGRTDIELGYATFFLNRCNRSGILKAGPIGGLEQTGNWKIDARFNRMDLAQRVRRLGRYRHRVSVTELDGRAFIQTLKPLGERVLVYVDPPYIAQGSRLYFDALSAEDHAELASVLRSTRIPWFLTYDVDERVIKELYKELNTAEFSMAHTAHVQGIGAEYVVFGPSLVVSGVNLVPGANTRWVNVTDAR